MVKFLTSLLLIIFLISCSKEEPIAHGDFQALKCFSKNKVSFDTYIFNRNNGYLYFYDGKNDIFTPLTKRFEFGYSSGNTIETYSMIKKNKLIIMKIDYTNNKNYKIKNIINLKTLRKRTIFKNKNNNFVSFKAKCNWIDPKMVIEY